MIYYPKPMHRQKAFSNIIYLKSDSSTTESLCERILSLPIHPYLDEEDKEKVCRVITRQLMREE